MGQIIDMFEPLSPRYLYSRTYQRFVPNTTCMTVRIETMDYATISNIHRLLRKSSNRNVSKYSRRVIRCLQFMHSTPTSVNEIDNIGYYLFRRNNSTPFLKIEVSSTKEIFDVLGQKWYFVQFQV